MILLTFSLGGLAVLIVQAIFFVFIIIFILWRVGLFFDEGKSTENPFTKVFYKKVRAFFILNGLSKVKYDSTNREKFYESKIEIAKKAVNHYPNLQGLKVLAENFFFLGLATKDENSRQNHFAQAANYADKLVDMYPADYTSNSTYAELILKSKENNLNNTFPNDLQLSLRYAKKALEALGEQKNSFDHYHWLCRTAYICLNLEKYKEAYSYLEIAVKSTLAQANPTVYLFLSIVMVQSRDWDQALESIEKTSFIETNKYKKVIVAGQTLKHKLDSGEIQEDSYNHAIDDLLKERNGYFWWQHVLLPKV